MDTRIRAVMLLTSDLDRAVSFYQQAFGLTLSRGGAHMAAFELEGASLAILTKDAATKLTGLVVGEPSELPSQFQVLQAGSTEAVDESIAKVRSAGGTILREPGENEWGGYSAAFRDPDGNAWSIGFNVEFYRA